MTDQGTHLMDVVQWMTNSGPPRSAVCQGQIVDAKGGEVPDVFSAVFEYPDFLATWTLDYASSHDYDWSILFQGDKAAMLMDRRGYRIYKDPGASPQPWSQGGNAEVISEEPDRDSAAAHPQNFLDSIRSRQQPNCTVSIAAAAVAGPHLANLSYREDRKIKA
jgi:predicted dehydrogenase